MEEDIYKKKQKCVWNNCKGLPGGYCLYKKPSAFKPCEYPDCNNYVEDSSDVTNRMDVFRDHEQYNTLNCYWNNQKGSCIRNKTVKPCCGYSKCSCWETRPACYC